MYVKRKITLQYDLTRGYVFKAYVSEATEK